ncbi:desulfoferrodoxin [Caldisericum exile]|uniref:Desulfoferrodoxin n=1 Tax=Caldisericum exile (strain DSM 21853 / NBRC 104410 / AZM16c01) TaxID=511051 RepID=A0A7U6JGE0_CALEA|nr:desulfoferrodoxin [Caldisericum exile]BAL81365.1 desulfoferrodoxin [Caldisericum exile AZM16c01]
MTQKFQIYKCEICGNIVEVVHEGQGTLVCCGQPMTLIGEKISESEAGQEKHIPVLEKMEHGTLIKVGSVPHPMEEEHYIEWIEAFNKDGKVVKVPLKPGDKAEAHIGWSIENIVEVRAYCNKHGLWAKRI